MQLAEYAEVAYLVVNNPKYFDMSSLAEADLSAVANLFLVERKQVSASRHPLDASQGMLSIVYTKGINVPSALAAFLNHEFYNIPQNVDLRKLHYSVNRFAFVDPESHGQKLCTTILGHPASFVDHLRSSSEDIRYVIKHPEILFMMRPSIDYRTAKTNLQNGYRPAL